MKECLAYIRTCKRWIPCEGKKPIQKDWNIEGNQYYFDDVTQDFPSYNYGLCIFKTDPMLVIDVDKLSDNGITYIQQHNTLPFNLCPELCSILCSIKITDVFAQYSISGNGVHVYVYSTDTLESIKGITRFNTTLDGLCDHIELFNAGANEENNKGKFIVWTAGFIDEFKLDVSITPKTFFQDTSNKDSSIKSVIFTDVNSLPIYTHKRPANKILEDLLIDEKFKLLYTQGINIKEEDINPDTLETVKENNIDISENVYRLISILVSNTQDIKTIDKLFKSSYFYKSTHWGTEHKWERVLKSHNKTNTVLAAFSDRVRAARDENEPDWKYFKSPYTTEVKDLILQDRIQKDRQEREQKKLREEEEKEKQRQEKEQERSQKKLREEEEKKLRKQEKEQKKLIVEQQKINTLKKIQQYVRELIDDNKDLYEEYKKLDKDYVEFDSEYIDDEFLENDVSIASMYWDINPFTFAIQGDSNNDWITYNKKTKTYEIINRKNLRIQVANILSKIFPNKTQNYRVNLAQFILEYYETLNKPIIDLNKVNVFFSYTRYEGYYYKVKNGILDTLNSVLINDTPLFLSFDILPITIDETFLESLKCRDCKPQLEGTVFKQFLMSSFPEEVTKHELEELTSNEKLTQTKKHIYELSNTNSKYKFSTQLIVLQRMLGYTILPRALYNSDKTLILYGVPGSGKSTLAKLLGYLLTGRRELSGLTTTFSALERNQYALAPFKTTPLIVVNELPDRFSTEIRGTLNAMISGESVEINEKFKPNYSAQLPGKVVLIGNVLPKIADTSGSLARRSIIVNFAVNVSETSNAIANIDEQLIQEDNLKAFFLFCLIGALSVLEDKSWVISKVGSDLLQAMQTQNNPIEEVLKECTEFVTPEELLNDMSKGNLLVPKAVLLKHMQEFLNSSYNLTPYSIKTFGSVGSMCAGITSYVSKHFNMPEYIIYGSHTLPMYNKYRKNSSSIHCFRGLRLKEFDEFKSDIDDIKDVF